MAREKERREALSLECTEDARRRLVAIYGQVPAVVYFVQRQDDGPIKIGWAQRIALRMTDLLCMGPERVIVRAVVPGGLALEAWFHRRHAECRRDRREWFDNADGIVADARAFGDLHAHEFERTGSTDSAAVHAVTALDQFVADLYKLDRNGATHREMAELTGMSQSAVRGRLASLRAMGFDIPYRRVYVPRGRQQEPWAHMSVDRGYRRLIG